MRKISWTEVAWSGLGEALTHALRAWRPPSLETELAYRNDLFAYLSRVLPNEAMLEKEYRHRGTTSDLYLRWKGFFGDVDVFFELKRHLRKKTELDRLVGQVEGLDPKRHIVFVILIGDLEASLVRRLRDRYEETQMELVEIPLSPSKNQPRPNKANRTRPPRSWESTT